MKKMFKAAALLAAAMMVMGFVSCSDSDDSDDTVLPAQGSGGGASSGGSETGGSSSGGSEKSDSITVDAKWDFVEGANASKNTELAKLDGKTVLSDDLVITADSGSGATFTLLKNNDNKPKYGNTKDGTFADGGGIAQNTKSNGAFEFAAVKVDSACTITVVARPGGSYAEGKVRAFYFDGAESSGYTMASGETAADQTVTYAASAAGTYKIFASGMKFISVACSQ